MRKSSLKQLVEELKRKFVEQEAKERAEAEKRLVCSQCGVGQCPRCYCD